MAGAVNLPSVQSKPHVPTLVWALIAIVAVVIVYHMIAGHRR